MLQLLSLPTARMRTLLITSVLLTVAWGVPFKPVEPQAPPPETLQQPLVGDLLPAQGHVVLENPAPQPELSNEVELSAQNPDNKEQEAMKIQEEFVEVPAEPSVVLVEPLKPDLTEENNEIKQAVAAVPFVEVSLESEGEEEVQSDLESNEELMNYDIVEEEEEKEPLQELDVEAKYNFEQPIMKLEPLEDEEPQQEMINNDFVEEEEKKSLHELNEHNDIVAKYNFEQPNMYLEPLDDEEPQQEMTNNDFAEEEEKESLHEPNDIEAKYNFEQPNMYLEPLTDQEMQRDELLAAPDVHHAYEQPIMYLEPETFDSQNVNEKNLNFAAIGPEEEEQHPLNPMGQPMQNMPYAAMAPEENEGPMLDPYGQPMQNNVPFAAIGPEEEERNLLNPMGQTMQNMPYAAMAPEDENLPMLDPYGQPMQNNVPFAAIGPGENEGQMLNPMGQSMRNVPYAAMAPGEGIGPMLDPYGQPLHRSDQYLPPDEGSRSQMMIPGEPLVHGQRSCPGVVLEGKCFQFFRNAKKASEAEYFCQQNFPEGHLASITCPYVHKQMMNLMTQNGGTRRTWVGGLRFLDSGRFVWLDGSHWAYADWLSGEPNNTIGKEDCIELLPTGKFNDFTCWEPQAFICSYPYQ